MTPLLVAIEHTNHRSQRDGCGVRDCQEEIDRIALFLGVRPLHMPARNWDEVQKNYAQLWNVMQRGKP